MQQVCTDVMHVRVRYGERKRELSELRAKTKTRAIKEEKKGNKNRTQVNLFPKKREDGE